MLITSFPLLGRLLKNRVILTAVISLLYPLNIQGSQIRSCSVLSLVGVNPSKFKFFFSQFHNFVSFTDSNKTKLALLKSYLTDYALQLISYLTLEDDNFHVAINLLKEFLDVPYKMHEIFKQILNNSPKFDSDCEALRQYLTEIRADLPKLKTSYNLDIFENNTPD